MKPQRSHSQYASYTRCGEAYRLEKVARVPRMPAVYLIGGTSFHAAIEAFERSRFGGTELTLQQTVDVFVAEFDQLTAEAVEIEEDLKQWAIGGKVSKAAPNREDLTWWRAAGQGFVKLYVDGRQGSTWKMAELPDGAPAIEVPYRIDYGTFYVVGYIDQVRASPDKTLTVVDLKTGAKPRSNMQLGEYAVAWSQSIGGRPAFGAYFMARDGKLTTPDDLAEWTAEVLRPMYTDLDRGVEAKIFLPNPGQNCSSCSVKRFCRVFGTDAAQYADIGLATPDAVIERQQDKEVVTE